MGRQGQHFTVMAGRTKVRHQRQPHRTPVERLCTQPLERAGIIDRWETPYSSCAGDPSWSEPGVAVLLVADL